MKKTMISVVLPCYNVGKYVKRCLDSLSGQTFKDIEIICVDDNSNDDTVKIVQMYIDERVKLIKNKKNMGVGYSRNIGLKKACGKYVAFIDPDDYVEDCFLENLFRIAEEKDCKIVKGRMFIRNVENETVACSSLNEKIKENRMFFYIEHFTALYNKQFLIGNNIFYPEDIKTGQDACFLSKICVTHTSKIYVSNNAVYYYVNKTVGSLDSMILSHDKVLARLKMLDYKINLYNNMVFTSEVDQELFMKYHIMEHFIGLYNKQKEEHDDNKLIFDWLHCNYKFITKRILRQYFNSGQLRALKYGNFISFCSLGYKINVFYKERLDNGKRNIYFLGIKIFSYKKQKEIIC